jgi:glycerol-3-phosphate dehydrogenase
MLIRNTENNEQLTVRTKLLINSTGPFADEFRTRITTEQPEKYLDRVAGSHLDVFPAITHDSFYITAGDGRLIFLLKRNEDGLVYTRIGTTERPLKDSEPTEGVTPSVPEVSYLKSTVLEFFPQAQVTNETIIKMDAGIRPLVTQRSKSAFEKSREHEIIRDKGIYHVLGVKLTDFRRVAHELLEIIPWGELHLNITDASRSRKIPLRPDDGPNKVYAEDDIVEMLRRTMIVHWKDYLERRRGLGPRVLAKTNRQALEREFEVMKDVMKWDDAQSQKEGTTN